jgi:hypothetical protein
VVFGAGGVGVLGARGIDPPSGGIGADLGPFRHVQGSGIGDGLEAVGGSCWLSPQPAFGLEQNSPPSLPLARRHQSALPERRRGV